VIQLKAHHFHNKNKEAGGYVIGTLIKNLQEKSITLPDKDGKPEQVKISELGLTYPVLALSEQLKPFEINDAPGPVAAAPLARGGNVAAQRGEQGGPKKLVDRHDFIVQIAWQPTPRGKRDEKKKEAASKATTAAPVEAPQPE